MVVMYDSVVCMYWLVYIEIFYISSFKMVLIYIYV